MDKKKKKKKNIDDEYNDVPNFDRSVELETEDIATNSKKNLQIIDNFIKKVFKKSEEDEES